MNLFSSCTIDLIGLSPMVIAFFFACIGFAIAHCDAMDGPVITTAKEALDKGNVTPVLKWVKPEYEADVTALFDKTTAVRKEGIEARQIADMYFYETLVRLHRAGEGAPYIGIKPAGKIEPIVKAADRAIESRTLDGLTRHMSEALLQGIQTRYARVVETRKHMNDTVDAGRAFVEAYVEFVHYVQGIYNKITSSAEHHEAVDEHQH